jgi:hypothetical protein
MVQFKVEGSNWPFDTAPNECPICHHGIDPRFLVGMVRVAELMGTAIVELVFQCPRSKCLHAFIGRYEGQYDRNTSSYFMLLRSTTPYNPPPPKHSEEVSTLSPQFVAVFSEAAAAESWNLKEVAGCGYRKALEFLVKDYCIAQHPSKVDVIKAKFLGKVIDEHIDDANIKACAKRATWLGNDETHYVRLWDDKDIDDLKALIHLTESWINTHLLTKKYMSGMPEKRP